MAEPRSGDSYQPFALIAIIICALLVFALFFLSFLVAPMLILALFYVGFAASDRSKTRNHAPQDEEPAHVPQEGVEERLAREAGAQIHRHPSP